MRLSLITRALILESFVVRQDLIRPTALEQLIINISLFYIGSNVLITYLMGDNRWVLVQ